MATGTVTRVSDSFGAGKIRKIVYTCTSDASGDVNSSALPLSGSITGEFQHAETIPDATTPPATSYNVQIRRGAITGFDMLNGSGASRSTSARELCHPEDDNGNATMFGMRDDVFYIDADTVGNAKTFQLILTFIQPA